MPSRADTADTPSSPRRSATIGVDGPSATKPGPTTVIGSVEVDLGEPESRDLGQLATL